MIKSRRMSWEGYVARMGGRRRIMQNAYMILVGKPGEKPLGKPRRRWVDNIKVHGMDWIDLAQDRDQCRALVNMVMNLRVP
jgi:hypothetical protein